MVARVGSMMAAGKGFAEKVSVLATCARAVLATNHHDDEHGKFCGKGHLNFKAFFADLIS